VQGVDLPAYLLRRQGRRLTCEPAFLAPGASDVGAVRAKQELKRIEMFLNDRPRKCLGWMTPREKMAAFLGYPP
jgi:hypothetical protein